MDCPEIGVVIIGLNVENYITDCIVSVLNADYPSEKLTIIYVDGGSCDRSVELARTFDSVRVIELKDPSPTPGRGRNAGYRAAGTTLIQFMDADTALCPRWFHEALPFLKENVAAVCGRRLERYPDKNFYHTIGGIEWRYEQGPCRYFGGEALIRRDILERCGGYDDHLIAGEDPDLSYRIRQKGWLIFRVDTDMTIHDLNMSRFRQYLKRAFRTGHAYAEIGLRYVGHREKLWIRELLRICVGVLFPPAMLALGAAGGHFYWSLLPAGLLFFRPFRKTFYFEREFGLSRKEALLYALHLSFVIIPQFAGVLRYFYTLVSRVPLRNRGYARELQV